MYSTNVWIDLAGGQGLIPLNENFGQRKIKLKAKSNAALPLNSKIKQLIKHIRQQSPLFSRKLITQFDQNAHTT